MRVPSVQFSVRGMAVTVAVVAVTLVALQMFWPRTALVARDWCVLGLQALNAGNLTEARERFRNALALEPGNASARQGLAVVAFRSDDFLEEYNHTTGAIESLEQSPPSSAPRNLALLYKSRAAAAFRVAGGRGASEQREWYARALKDLEVSRGLTQRSDTEVRFAIEYVAASTELSWRDAERRAGDTGAALAHHQRARRALDEARSMKPGDRLIKNLLAEFESRPSPHEAGNGEL